MTRRRATYICGGEEFAGATGAPLDHRWDACPNAARHAPMPAGYLAWHAVAQLRLKAGQRTERCPACGRWLMARGGRAVPGWPRTMKGVAHAS